MHPLAQLDHRYLWHPFTQMRDWLKAEPIVIVSGKGARLRDAHGREYLDANSSIWTNLHGHNHPRLNAAIRRQLGKLAHSSALGLANEPASRLAAKLVEAANPLAVAPASRRESRSYHHSPGESSLLTTKEWGEGQGEGYFNCIAAQSPNPSPQTSPRSSLAGRGGPTARSGDAASVRQWNPALSKVFFSDDGSTAMEVALKLAYLFARRTGRSQKPKFLALEGAYHGDTVGAVALGHIDLFHKAYAGLLFKTDQVMAPYCYRCPFNRAQPERGDARDYRKCRWECLGKLERKFAAQKQRGNAYAAFVFEPLLQGAAGMIPQPAGWLSRAAEIARACGALLIADEVMTGFGRTGLSGVREGERPREPKQRSKSGLAGTLALPLFACHHEGVQPDFMALAKGLTGGYLPMAATLTTQAVFDAFLGEYDEFKTFFHGHSFTGNQLGAAAGLASLELLQTSGSLRARQRLEQTLRDELRNLWRCPAVGDIRQAGLVAGIELVQNWRTREPFDLRARAGIRVCAAMARRGVLTRAIGNVIVLLPPYCTTPTQARRMVSVLGEAIQETCPGPSSSRSSSA